MSYQNESFSSKWELPFLLSPSSITQGRMGARKVALILMKNSQFDRTPQYLPASVRFHFDCRHTWSTTGRLVLLSLCKDDVQNRTLKEQKKERYTFSANIDKQYRSNILLTRAGYTCTASRCSTPLNTWFTPHNTTYTYLISKINFEKRIKR